jgi:hypothetical protein
MKSSAARRIRVQAESSSLFSTIGTLSKVAALR